MSDEVFAFGREESERPKKARRGSGSGLLFVGGGITVFLLFCCCGLVGIGFVFQESIVAMFAPAPKGQGNKKDGLAAAGVDFAMDSGDFTDHFIHGDLRAADKKFKNKMLELTGEFRGVARVGNTEKLVVALDVNGTEALEFEMKPSEKDRIVRLSDFQRIKIAGRYLGHDNRVILFNFDSGRLIEELQPSRMVETTVTEYVSECIKDADKAGMRFGNHTLLRGEILEYSPEPESKVVFKVEGGRPVDFVFRPEDSKEATRLARAKAALLRITHIDYDPRRNLIKANTTLVVEAK